MASLMTDAIAKTNKTVIKSEAKGILNWVDPKDNTGEFKRQVSSFRDWIEDKPDAKFPAEKGRYHLYVSYACPWGRYLVMSHGVSCTNS
jgi:glutathionyl-hydroquinone reductase